MKLTEKQAYAAMFYYLENLYELINFDDLGGFLGSMTILEDGLPADPASWSDWQKATQTNWTINFVNKSLIILGPKEWSEPPKESSQPDFWDSCYDYGDPVVLEIYKREARIIMEEENALQSL